MFKGGGGLPAPTLQARCHPPPRPHPTRGAYEDLLALLRLIQAHDACLHPGARARHVNPHLSSTARLCSLLPSPLAVWAAPLTTYVGRACCSASTS